MNISIPVEEWTAVQELLVHLENNLSHPKAHVHVSAMGGRRWWKAFGESTAVRLPGGADDGEWSFNLPGIALKAFEYLLTEIGDVVIDFEEDERRVILAYEETSFSFDRLLDDHPVLNIDFDRPESSTYAKLSAETLARSFTSDAVHPIDADRQSSPIEVLIEDGCLAISARFGGINEVTLAVECECTGESRSVIADPMNFSRMIKTFSLASEVEISLSSNPYDPIRMSDGAIIVLQRVVENKLMRATRHVEKVITSALGSLVLNRDDDGDYPLRRHGIPIYGRVFDVNPPLFQVFAVVLDGVESSPELLSELNAYNASLEQARIFHVDDQVLAEVDLIAESLDDIELRTSMNRIVAFAEKIAPTLQIVFGGNEMVRAEDQRWIAYKSAIISAEVSPSATSILNGANAVVQWPFPDSAFVLTGWNPQGLDQPGNEANAFIAKEVLASGGRLVMGQGSWADSDYCEPSIVAWGVTLDFARELGRRAAQDAIFMIDEDNVYLIACFTERTEHWPRRSI